MYTNETPAFGEISLALRGSGAIGAPVGAPLAPISAAVKQIIQINKIWGAVGAPNFNIFPLFYRRPRRRQMGAQGATPPEGEGNLTEGGCFASMLESSSRGVPRCKTKMSVIMISLPRHLIWLIFFSSHI